MQDLYAGNSWGKISLLEPQVNVHILHCICGLGDPIVLRCQSSPIYKFNIIPNKILA